MAQLFSPPTDHSMHPHRNQRRLPAATLVVLALAGCGGASAGSGAGSLQSQRVSQESSALASTNGLSLNGVSVNGVSVNGVSVNGVSVNGVSVNGVSVNGVSVNGASAQANLDNGLAANGFTASALAKPAFAAWFDASPGTSAMLMSYLAKCALGPTASLTWTDPAGKTVYVWPGNFGLTPVWAGGVQITVIEQQLITACLIAHANKYGVHVPIAVEGETSWYLKIPIAAGELTTYSVREAAFFGNGFTGEGFFACVDHANWDAKTSSPRACALDTTSGASADCPPINVPGDCKDLCTADSTGTYYETCKVNGKTYKPLVTRLMPSAVYTCGDGVCEFTESCGPDNSSASSCKSDCGACTTPAAPAPAAPAAIKK